MQFLYLTRKKVTKPFVIRIVDDDEDVLMSLSIVLEGRGWTTRTYTSAKEFLKNDPLYERGCLLLDIQMPGMDGLEVQEFLSDERVRLPIIFMTAYATVDLAVHTMKYGAFDFFQKPVDIDKLCKRLTEVKQLKALSKFKLANEAELEAALSDLSLREKEVLSILALSDISNREVGERLNLSERTIEGHRQSLYKKLNLHNRADLLDFMELQEESDSISELFQQFLR